MRGEIRAQWYLSRVSEILFFPESTDEHRTRAMTFTSFRRSKVWSRCAPRNPVTPVTRILHERNLIAENAYRSNAFQWDFGNIFFDDEGIYSFQIIFYERLFVPMIYSQMKAGSRRKSNVPTLCPSIIRERSSSVTFSPLRSWWTEISFPSLSFTRLASLREERESFPNLPKRSSSEDTLSPTT